MSNDDMADPSDLTRYPEPEEVDEKRVHSVQLDSFLSYMVDKLRRQALGLPEPEMKDDPFTKEDIEATLPDVFNSEGPYSPQEILDYAIRTPFEVLPVAGQGFILDKLFGFLRDDEHTIDLVSIHILHTLHAMGNGVQKLVNDWLETRHSLLNKFMTFELQSFRFRQDVKRSINSPWDPDAYQIPQAEVNIGVQAATTCVKCFEFLVKQELILAEGYDVNGKSFLAWALEKKHQPVVDFIIQNSTYGGMLLEAINDEMNLLDERNPLLLLIEHRNLRGFKSLIERLTLGGEEGMLSRSRPLLEMLNIPRYKLLLCSFVSVELAEFLLQELDINIGDVEYKRYTGKEEKKEDKDEDKKDEDKKDEDKKDEDKKDEDKKDEDKKDEDKKDEDKKDEDKKDDKKDEQEKEDSDTQNIDFKFRPITSSWHEAARWNPHGADFMEWLDLHSGTLVHRLRNKQGLTPLMYAAYGDNAASVKYLMGVCDPAATITTRSAAKTWPLIKIVAQNFSYDSDAMFIALLEKLPPIFFRDFEAIADLFDFITDGLWSRGFNPKAAGPQPAFPEGTAVTIWLAVSRCQALANRAHRRWTHSQEQFLVTARARSYGYSFLPPNMIKKSDGECRKPPRLVKPESQAAPIIPATSILS